MLNLIKDYRLTNALAKKETNDCSLHIVYIALLVYHNYQLLEDNYNNYGFFTGYKKFI